MRRKNKRLPNYDLLMLVYERGKYKNGQKFVTKEHGKPAQLIDGKLYWIDSDEPIEIIVGINCSKTFIHFIEID